MLISGRQRKVWHLNMIYHGTEAVKCSNGWYLVVLGQYGVELVYTGWYWDSIGRYRAFMPVYIEKYGDLVGCHHSRTRNKQEGKIELLSQWTNEGWDEQKVRSFAYPYSILLAKNWVSTKVQLGRKSDKLYIEENIFQVELAEFWDERRPEQLCSEWGVGFGEEQNFHN